MSCISIDEVSYPSYSGHLSSVDQVKTVIIKTENEGLTNQNTKQSKYLTVKKSKLTSIPIGGPKEDLLLALLKKKHTSGDSNREPSGSEETVQTPHHCAHDAVKSKDNL